MTFLRRQDYSYSIVERKDQKVLDNIFNKIIDVLRLKSRLMRQRRAETSRILSRGKGTFFIRGGGGRILSRHRKNKKIIIIPSTTIDYQYYNLNSTALSYLSTIIDLKRYESAACMIIEDNPPLPDKKRHNPHQDTTQRFLNHLVLPKHRTLKFSSNRHRKLEPFRET